MSQFFQIRFYYPTWTLLVASADQFELFDRWDNKLGGKLCQSFILQGSISHSHHPSCTFIDLLRAFYCALIGVFAALLVCSLWLTQSSQVSLVLSGSTQSHFCLLRHYSVSLICTSCSFQAMAKDNCKFSALLLIRQTHTDWLTGDCNYTKQ